MINQLSNILDEIWHSRESRLEIAQREVKYLSLDSLLVLVGWDVGATCGLQYGKVLLERPDRIRIINGDITLLESRLTRDTTLLELIRYSDSEYMASIDASSSYVPKKLHHEHSLSRLLLSLQIIRDHMDTVNLHPGDLRTKELAIFADEAQIDIEYFSSLSGWFSSISMYLGS